ncbi:MAG TPA: helicase-related protein, partial [Deinococcales bacterium]|nr:helicase-related protein [Deinococcales bacterium]
YGAGAREPQFLLTSATLGNPGGHARALTGRTVTHLSEDTSARSGRDWYVLQPPLLNEELGIRRSALQEAVLATARLVQDGKQVLLFCGSRQAAEEAVLNLRPLTGAAVRSYRSGLLPQERRHIERELQDGTVRAVAATSALELGVDIGSVDAVVMAGYPGTAAAFRQQAGRAGRRNQKGLAVLTLGGSPLDQYLAAHPEHLFGTPSEQVLCDPDHLLIALDHLRCAAFELPVAAEETFGKYTKEEVQLLLDQLSEDGEIHQAGGTGWWIGQSYPAAELSLRNTGGGQVTLQADSGTVGTVDALSARWLTHPGAIYVHDGQPFEVTALDLEANTATLEPAD